MFKQDRYFNEDCIVLTIDDKDVLVGFDIQVLHNNQWHNVYRFIISIDEGIKVLEEYAEGDPRNKYRLYSQVDGEVVYD